MKRECNASLVGGRANPLSPRGQFVYCCINFVKEQLILNKPLKDQNAKVKSAICRDKSAVFTKVPVLGTKVPWH